MDPDLLATEPDVPWRSMSRMRDRLAHRYFDTDDAVIQDVLHNELVPLRNAVEALLKRSREGTDVTTPLGLCARNGVPPMRLDALR